MDGNGLFLVKKNVLKFIVPLENVHRHRFFHGRDDLFSLKPEGKLGEVSNAPNRELDVAFLELLQLFLAPR
jgi:hypothetical protein